MIFAVDAGIQALALFGPGMRVFGLQGAAAGIALGVVVLVQLVVGIYRSAWHAA